MSNTLQNFPAPKVPFVFALEAVTPGTPEANRVRRLLKRLGRDHHLRVSFPQSQPVSRVESPATPKSRRKSNRSANAQQTPERNDR